MKSNIVDIEVKLHHQTEKAILVSDDGEKESAVWLPLSQIEWDESTSTVTLPDWLALEKGLT